jgi:polyisoprenyl-teichoic acid--peptidoglycan teichoic acid transferase
VTLMRLSGLVLGIAGFFGLIVLTGICSFASFAFTRDGIVDLWENGIRVESANEVFSAVLNPEAIPASATPSGSNVVMIPSITPISTAAPTQDPNSLVAATQIELSPTLEITSVPTDEFAAARWGDPREINILLMGIDERAGFTEETAYRTDTMMVLHIDPVRRTAGLISFLRDLYVPIPGYGQARLNTANDLGDRQAYPNGGGPGLLMETLNTNFGLNINYYVRINFTVFETVIDQLAPEGIEVCPQERIYDDHYPDEGFGVMVVEFQPGCQRLQGQRLLQYARTRATANSDLDRAARQQEVMEATRNHVLSAGGVQNFVTSLAPLWDELQGSYITNLSLNQIISLALLMNDIEDINYQVIDFGYIMPQTVIVGGETQEVLVPIPSQIQRLIQETFYPAAELSLGDYRSRAEAENAVIRIYNNTDIAGLAGNTREYLLGQGLVIDAANISNMPTPSNQPTVIRDYGGGRDTALYIAALLGLPQSRVERGADGIAASGVVIVVGTDMPGIISGE